MLKNHLDYFTKEEKKMLRELAYEYKTKYIFALHNLEYPINIFFLVSSHMISSINKLDSIIKKLEK